MGSGDLGHHTATGAVAGKGCSAGVKGITEAAFPTMVISSRE
ncbi:MAG: hypothetical protein FD149_2397 [Rhodospirillaceae bacterium]|nr:MAG: hypothetical protein FD149_2397 [Rhodospirillaceae bacterium]